MKIFVMNKKGFTLVELIVVVVILGVMAAVAAPILQTDLTSLRTQWALEDVRSMSRYCQRYAMETQRWCRVTFRTSDEEARLHYATSEATNGGWTQLNHPTTGGKFEVQIGQGDYVGVDITGVDIEGSNSYMFDGEGVPHDRGTINDAGDLPAPITTTGTVTFNGASGWQIQIEPETGYITIVDI